MGIIEDMPFAKGIKPWNTGKRYSLKHSGQFKKGFDPWNKGTNGLMSKVKPDSFKRYRKNAWMGKNNPNWKGGSSQKEKIIKNSAQWREWRKAVFERDNYTCQMCGKRGSIKLHPDHIKPFSKYVSLRFDVDNGRTLCVPCHRSTPTYGSKCLLNKVY